MADEDIGWFKVSRRILKSSRWWREPPATFKVLMFLLAEAQAIENPSPGEVHMGPTAIAGACGLVVGDVEAALKALASHDLESQTRSDKRTIEELPDGGGYRLVNYDTYHPGARKTRELSQIKRTLRAKKAANARWGKKHDYTSDAHQECLQDDLAAPEGPSPQQVEEESAWLIGVEGAVGEVISNYTMEGNDILLARGWYQDGIPLRVALEAIKGASKPAPGVEREIRSLAYFTGPVRDEWERVRKGMTV